MNDRDKRRNDRAHHVQLLGISLKLGASEHNFARTMFTKVRFVYFVLFFVAKLALSQSAVGQLSYGYLSSDQVAGAQLNANDRSAVILIHGWNPDGHLNHFAQDDWPGLVNALRNRLAGTDTRLLLFHWEDDAATGPIDFTIFGLTAFDNARHAANNAFLNGGHLADLVNQAAPDLRKVVIVAHSAGTWAAYRALDRLLQKNPYVVANLVLLDPFVPGVDPSIPSVLNTATLNQLGSHSAVDRIFRLENYYALDATDTDFDWGNGGGSRATSQTFNSWRSRDINHRVDYNSTLGFYYDGHGGPIRFYAETVLATTQGQSVPNGLARAPWQFTDFGFYRGLVNEGFLLPAFTAHPQSPGQPVQLGETASFSVAANRTDFFQWFKNREEYPYTDTTLQLSSVTTSDAGTYVARAGNSQGVAFSEKAILQVVAPATPTITGVTPRIFSAQSGTRSLTISGTNFTAVSRLLFDDGVNSPYDRAPLTWSPNQLTYDISSPNPATWTVVVDNGGNVKSEPYTFYAVPSGAQLTGLAIVGPSAIEEGDSGQFTATAFFSNGSTNSVTPTWSENSSATSISLSGVLSTNSVSSDTTVSVSATYSVGGITKTATTSVVVANAGSGGGSQTTNVIVNGGFESGATPWAPSGYADVVNLSYPRSGSWYAYTGNTASASAGSIAQFFPIPAAATAATLSFYIDIATAETTTTQKFDKLKVDLATGSDQYVETIAEFSNLDKGDNVNGTYVSKSYNIMSMLNAYKGQSLFLIFSGTTDTGNSTIFRIDDVKLDITTPTPVNLTGLSISGPSSIGEGQLEAYYAQAIFSDGTTQTVSPNSWGENSSSTTIDANGYLVAAQVNSDTTVTVSTSYTFNGVTKQATKSVTVIDLNPPVTFSTLAINGPGSVNESSNAQYTATAIMSDGSTQSVSPSWSENSSATSISSSGLLSAGEVSSDRTVTVSATHTISGVTRSASHSVLVVNSATPPTFTSLAISGPGTISEQTAEVYTAEATFSDGSTEEVVPTWSENSSVTSISIFGLLSAGDIASNTNVTVSASATIGGVTRNANKTVTVLASNLPPTITSAGAASGVVGQPFQYLIAVQNGPATLTALGLPVGLALNAATSTIEGTPTIAGVFSVPLTATTGIGSVNGTVVITITNNPSNLPYEFKWASAITTQIDRPTKPTSNDGALTFNGPVGTRLDGQGHVVWSVTYGNGNPDVEISDCERHPGGGWAVSGYFRNTAVFGSVTLVSAGSRDPFLMRIDDNGTVLWARRCGGTQVDYGRAIAVDGAGNCFLAGEFTTSATFGGTVTLNAIGTRFDLFVAKYSATGEFQWVRQMGGAEYDTLASATADASGNVYVAGTFEIQATVGGQSLAVQGNQASQDAFIVKYGSGGDTLWVKHFGEPSGSDSLDFVGSLEIDAGGNCFFGGSFEGPLTVDGQTLRIQDDYTALVGKIAASGTVSWMRAIPADGESTDVDFIAVMPDSSVIVAGRYRGMMTFGPSVLTPENLQNPLEENIFIARFDAAASPTWAIAVHGSGWKDLNYFAGGTDSKLLFGADFEATQVSLPGLAPLTNTSGGTVLGVLGPRQEPTNLTFNQWLGGWFTAQELATPALSGLDADIDDDGLNTLFEFVMGRNPRVVEMGGGTLVDSVQIGAAKYLTISFIRRTGANSGVTVAVQESPDLVTWNSINIQTNMVGTPTPAGSGFETITVRGNIDLNAPNLSPGGFLRLQGSVP